MKTLGHHLKEKRIEKSITLRQFCKEASIDPSNWSKIERGILEAPKSEKVLKEISNILNLSNEEFQEIKDMAILESIPNDLKPSESILEALPVFFRTVRDLKPTEEELRKLIEILKADK